MSGWLKIVGVISLLLGAVPPSVAQTYLVAADALEVTPEVGSYLAGYGADRKATGMLDPLYLKCVVIADAQTTLIIMTLDSIGLTRPHILRIQQQLQERLPHAKLVFSSTHTHAGPDVVGIWGPALWRSGRDEAYLSALIDQAAQLAERTYAARRPVTSRVVSSEQGFAWVENVSEPELLDQRLAVLQFIDEQGQTLATLTNFACHPTVLGPNNTLVSADFVHGFYQRMQDQLPGEHLFLQGAIGGWVQPLQGDRSHQRAAMLGTELAMRVAEQLNNTEANPYQPLAYRQAQIDIPLENWGFRLLIWLGVLDRQLYDGAMRTQLSWFKIGRAQFVTHPGETSPAYSIASREMLDTPHSFVMGLSQDAMGYILKPDYFADDANYPHAEYLTSVSVGASAGPLIMQSLERLVD